jgi:hypothetical protein
MEGIFFSVTLWSLEPKRNYEPEDRTLHSHRRKNPKSTGRAIAQTVSRWLPTAAVRGSKPDLGMWDLWWDKVALGQVFSEFFGFPCNRRSLQQLLHNHSHVSSGECTRGQCVAAVLGLTGT